MIGNKEWRKSNSTKSRHNRPYVRSLIFHFFHPLPRQRHRENKKTMLEQNAVKSRKTTSENSIFFLHNTRPRTSHSLHIRPIMMISDAFFSLAPLILFPLSEVIPGKNLLLNQTMCHSRFPSLFLTLTLSFNASFFVVMSRQLRALIQAFSSLRFFFFQIMS